MNKHILLTITLFLLMGVLISVGLLSRGLSYLEEYRYEKKSEFLEQAAPRIKHIFSTYSEDDWQEKIAQDGLFYDLVFTIREIERLHFIPMTKLGLQDTPIGETYFDPHNELLYFKLNEMQAIMLHPRWNTITETVAKNYSFMLLIGLAPSFLFVLGMLWVQNRQKKQLIRSVLDNEVDPSQFETLAEFGRYIKKQLAEQRSKIQATSEFQRDLMHGIVHEIKSPLSRIQFALDELESSSHSKQLSRIDKHTDDLDKMARELLTYARFEFSEKAINKEQVNYSELIQSCVHRVAEHYSHIRFKPQVAEVYLHCNYELMERTLVNILRNAGRFAATECCISISDIGSSINIFIEDDGAGVPPGKRQQIFEPFTRNDNRRSDDSAGVGLGLAICKSIIKRHQGSISVDESTLGGAKFSIILPKPLS